MPPDPLALAILFLSTLSLRRATQITVMQATDAMPFLSTLSLRRATIPCGYFVTPIVFLSTLSLRRATLLIVAIRGIVLNFYPRSPCGERRLIPDARELSSIISIHALLAESDAYIMTTIICIVLFLSTLSLRRATSFSLSAPPAHDNFYPRSPCGERQRPSWACRICRNFYPRSPCGERPEPDPCIAGPAAISIHALLAESDLLTSVLISSADWISIHALLAESDFGALCGAAGVADFYPRSPCGERRKATNAAGPNNQISIHALLAESDLSA